MRWMDTLLADYQECNFLWGVANITSFLPINGKNIHLHFYLCVNLNALSTCHSAAALEFLH